DGLGLLLPVSRAISAAPNPRQAAEDLNRQINHLCQEIAAERSAAGRSDGSAPAATGPGLPVSAPQTGDLQALADGLLDLGCVKFGSFTLKSGLQSPVYLDLRQLVSRPALLEAAGRAYVQLLRGLSFDRLAALPYAALPIGTAVSLLGGWPLIYPRKETKEYGTKAAIEGLYQPGERIVIIDDLATTGGSKFEAIEKMSAAGLQVQDVVVLIDRQSGAAEALAAQGYRLHAVLHFTALLDYWQAAGRVDPDRIDAARQFIRRSRQG
ncbi:MAG: orotate phosphoribosyltransferase, partial [Chloroflexota bacterium]